jgi:hypothetical protein
VQHVLPTYERELVMKITDSALIAQITDMNNAEILMDGTFAVIRQIMLLDLFCVRVTGLERDYWVINEYLVDDGENVLGAHDSDSLIERSTLIEAHIFDDAREAHQFVCGTIMNHQIESAI